VRPREADSTEFNPGTPHRVIFKLRELKGVDELGGTMRLGSWPCRLVEDSFACRAYGAREIAERHRHRYEFNREYEKTLIAAGLRITGETPDQTYVEICELADHPWYLGCQFHPEFKSKPMHPHPLFTAFIEPLTRTVCGGCRRRKSRYSAVPIDYSAFDPGQPLVLIAGPCVIESEEHVHRMARGIREAVGQWGGPPGLPSFVFKASFDKANRSSGATYRGPGLKEACASWPA